MLKNFSFNISLLCSLFTTISCSSSIIIFNQNCEKELFFANSKNQDFKTKEILVRELFKPSKQEIPIDLIDGYSELCTLSKEKFFDLTIVRSFRDFLWNILPYSQSQVVLVNKINRDEKL